MALRPSKPKQVDIQTFDPTLFSFAENEFLLRNLGKPTIVALEDLKFPVNPRAVKPLLDRVNDLEQLKAHTGADWCGIEAVKAAIQVYLKENAKWASMHKRNKRAPRWPSLYSFDARGKAHRAASGSDCHRVRTYFNEKGERVPFEIYLIPDNVAEWIPPSVEQPLDKRLIEDSEKNRIECFCGHTESFKQDSRASRAAARARISKHLRTAKDRVEEHREVYTLEFGG
jgi:hypothetical protein